jgi:hypothetical protein
MNVLTVRIAILLTILALQSKYPIAVYGINSAISHTNQTQMGPESLWANPTTIIASTSAFVAGVGLIFNGISTLLNRRSLQINAENSRINAETLKINAESLRLNMESLRFNANSQYVKILKEWETDVQVLEASPDRTLENSADPAEKRKYEQWSTKYINFHIQIGYLFDKGAIPKFIPAYFDGSFKEALSLLKRSSVSTSKEDLEILEKCIRGMEK